MANSRYTRRSINLDDTSHERCRALADDMSLSISGFLRLLINETFNRRIRDLAQNGHGSPQ